MKLSPRRTGAVVAAGALVLTGCSALSNDSEPAEDRQIAAAFYPLAYAAQRVAGDHFDVVTLTQPGKEAHDLDLNVKSTATLAESAVVIYESSFQPALDNGVEQNATGVRIDAAEVIDLRPSEDVHGEQEEGHEGHGHEDEADGESHDGHDHGDLDLHFWQDPLLMAEFADAIAEELADLAPDAADDIRAHAASFRAELTDLDAAYTTQLSGCERDTVVVNHEAFGYLSRYGLHFEAITGLSPGAEATIADRARLQDLIASDGITTVFSEALGSDKTAITVAKDAGVKAEVLDPIEGLSDLTADEDYLSLMRSNLAKLVEANGC